MESNTSSRSTKEYQSIYELDTLHRWIQGGGGQGSDPPPPENHKNIMFLSNTGRDPLKESQRYQASIQCWAIIGPPVKHHLNDDGPFIVIFGSSKHFQIRTASDKAFWIPHALYRLCWNEICGHRMEQRKKNRMLINLVQIC